jgi:3-deoxy-manno-octulosonate cytidylyltransferase (CMP-KDO synthetase)
LRTLAVIPARLGATRLPRKPLRLLAGLPLVARVWQRVIDIGVAERVIVATDSRDVAEAASCVGAEVFMTSDRHQSGTERVAEVASTSEFGGYDVIVNVQGDEPFVSRDAVLGAARMVSERGFPLGTVAAVATSEILSNPNVVKVVTADDGRAMYFSRAAIPFLRNAEDAELQRSTVRQHLGVYAYAPATLRRWMELPEHALERIERLEQLRALAAGIPIGVALIDEPVRPGIDTEEDLERANREWADFSRG